MRRFALVLAVLSLAACSNNPPPVASPPPAVVNIPPVAGEDRVLAYWMQFGSDGVAEARAVVSGTRCPVLSVRPDGDVAMKPRATGDQEFSLVCSAALPKDAKFADIKSDGFAEDARQLQADVTDNSGHLWGVNAGWRLPIPTNDPQRILVIGDTGCRLKGSLVQPCNDARQWPFPVIARKAADLKPDLVIHVGDYLYRENACPADDAGCQGTPFGDNWPTWAADFFTPGQPLLAAAPWVFVRGNHEDCQRAGPGWARLLAPAPFDPANICADHTPPFSVPLKAMTLVVMDNASAPDTAVDASAVPVYRQELTALGSGQVPVWALMHRPIWAAVSGPLGVPIGGNATEIEAAGKNGIPKPVELLIAGHIHTFEAINYVDHKVPPQILAGGGGDLLDKTPENLGGTIFQGSSGVSVKDGLSINGFSFLLFTKAAAGWDIQVYDQDGLPVRHCTFAGGRVDCPNPKS